MPHLLTINGGSSSIKFSLFTHAHPPALLLSGQVQRIGKPDATLSISHPAKQEHPIQAGTPDESAKAILAHLQRLSPAPTVTAIAHRIVHAGPRLHAHQPITPEVLKQLSAAQPMDMAHLPGELALIHAFMSAYPNLPHIACFDTVFHNDLPDVAKRLPIPRALAGDSLRRFGFHGLSYTYLMQQLAHLASPAAAQGRVLLAHLGSGASMAAVHHGKPIDTTMGFTPLPGLVMGTRPGDLDPGLLVYLMRTQKMSADQLDEFLNKKCGLLGISESSADMRDLLKSRATDPRAAQAVEAFTYHARKQAAAMVAAMQGLDTLVFTGGIGEHAPEIRSEICSGLTFLGVHLDPAANTRSHAILSTHASPVTIRLIPANEEQVMAQILFNLL